MASTALPLGPNPHFVAALQEMRHHYKSGARAPFALFASANVHQLIQDAAARPRVANDDGGGDGDGGGGDDGTAAIQAQLNTIHDQAKTSQNASTQAQQAGATDATNTLKSDKDATDFKAKMEAQRDKAKKDSDATIDKAYDAAETAGANATPQQQNLILTTMNTITTTLQNIIGGIVDILTKLFSSVMDILSGLLKDPLALISDGFEALAFL
jgi:hypothetical protein